ncbi:MAG TPA: CdaR family protein [Thermoanaerobaculia bacterium]|nr:CdaR family protein [Thermoanaerobaculia bacterium]
MSDGLRTWGLRLLALGIAVALWFSISLEDRQALSERLVEASVSYNRPRGLIILDQVPSVRVRVRGGSKQVRELNPFQVNVQVDVERTSRGTFSVNLGPENVLLPEGLEVVSVEPTAIRVEVEPEGTKRLLVVPKLVGEPAAGSIIEELEVFPSQVLVSGPESLLRRTESLETIPIRLDGHALTFEVEVPVVQPDPLVQIVQPTRVTVRIPLRQPGKDDGPAEDQESKP